MMKSQQFWRYSLPLFRNNIWLNPIAAIAAGYYGIIIPAKMMGVNVSENL